jgi:hypothetical protein
LAASACRRSLLRAREPTDPGLQVEGLSGGTSAFTDRAALFVSGVKEYDADLAMIENYR